MVREGEGCLDRIHQPVEEEADDADRQNRDHNLGKRLAGSILELVPNEFTKPRVLREHFRRDQHHPAHAQRQAHSGEDIRQRGGQDELGQLVTLIE